MLISKKDLLTETNISYGQLYRWKREGLIPEDWFIKQPSFTGQETFFPKTKILNRIKAIQELKDKYSLEELSKILSPEISERFFTVEDLNIIDEIEKNLIPCFCKCFQKESFSFVEVIILIAISDCRRNYKLQLYDIESLCEGIKDNISSIKLTDYMFVLIDINGEYYVTLYSEASQICFDKRLNKLCQIRLNEISSKRKVKYRKSFNFKFDNEEASPFEYREEMAVLT